MITKKLRLLSRLRPGQKFWLFASDGDDDYLIRGRFVPSLGKYACYIHGDVLTFVAGRIPVFFKGGK